MKNDLPTMVGNNLKKMKKLGLILFVSTFTLNVCSQEKKLLLRFNEFSKSELGIKNKKYIEKGKTKSLGTIQVYSKKVMIHNEEKQSFETFEIKEIRKEGERKLFISKNKDYVFALSENKRFFTKIGKKERIIYNIINFKYAEE